MEKFNQIHCHSVYSALDACSTPEELVEQASKAGHSALALTDHGAFGGLYRLQMECLAKDIKPLLGTEGYVVDELETFDEKGKRLRTKNNHLVMIAKNKQGWKNLLWLNYFSNDDNHYYYKPRITFNELYEHHEGIIVSTACVASTFSNLLHEGKEKEANERLDKFVEVFKDDLYLELQLNEIEWQKQYNAWLIDQATKRGLPLIITGDCHYALPEGAALQELTFKIRKNEDGEAQEFECRNLYYHKIDDYKNFNKQWGYGYTDEQIEQWCGNTLDLSAKVDFMLPERTKMFLPRQALDEDAVLINNAKKGLCKFFGVDSYEKCPQEYRDRIDFELKLMIKKGIARYMLLLEDVLRWAEKNNISHGPARGCFLPNNKVRMADLSFKEIKDIKKGDEIYSGLTGKLTFVEDVFKYNIEEPIVSLFFGDKEISCTFDHKIYTDKWTEAKDIAIGTPVKKTDGTFEKVDSIEVYDYIGEVYDLKIHGDDHSYNVEDFIVHNSAGGSLVAMCLGITSPVIDAIKYKLLFERFVSEARLKTVMVDYSKDGNN